MCERVEGQLPVYKAECLRGDCAGRGVLVKHAEEPTRLRSLLHEARVLAMAADCAHVVDAASPLITDGYCGYLVLPQPAGDLAHLATRFAALGAASRLTWAPLLEVAAQAFLALHSLHQLDLVHSNVGYHCLHYYGDPCSHAFPEIKLSALEFAVAPGNLTLSRPEAAVVAAPEARAGVVVADFAVDVYSMAVLCLGFFCQVIQPLSGLDAAYAASTPQSAPPAATASCLPQSVAAILNRCVHPIARQRFSSTEAAAAFNALTLHSELAGQPCRVLC